MDEAQREAAFLAKEGGARPAGTKRLLLPWRTLPDKTATANKSLLRLFFQRQAEKKSSKNIMIRRMFFF